MTTKELSRYLKLHEITICKHATEGTIPAIRIGPIWRFDQDAIDAWVAEAHSNPGTGKDTQIGKRKKPSRKTKLKKRKR